MAGDDVFLSRWSDDDLSARLDLNAHLGIAELGWFEPFLRANSWFLSEDEILARVETVGSAPEVLPYSKEVVRWVIDALHDRRPFSLIRLGDGEGNLLTWPLYPETPALNGVAAKKILDLQTIPVAQSEEIFKSLANGIFTSIVEADVVGIVGLFRLKRRTIDERCAGFAKDPRGISGHHRLVYFFACQAERFIHKRLLFCSAHIYFAFLNHLQILGQAAREILCITNQAQAVDVVRKYVRDKPVHGINLDEIFPPKLGGYSLIDLGSILDEAMPEPLPGRLVLIGAGPLAEVFCARIKRRGEVAIDIGSGFDLLVGKETRPFHRAVKTDENYHMRF